MSELSPTESRPPTTGVLPSRWVDLLFEVTRQFASSLELDEVLGKVLNLTVDSVQASEGSIFLLDGDGRVTRSILARTQLPPTVKRPTVAAVMSRGLAGWAYQHRQAALITDTQSDDRWHVLPDSPLITRSAMAVPLVRRDLIIGMLTLTHPEPGRFGQRHLALLEAIAAQAASAIENAALYTRASSERSTLRAIISGVEDIILVADLDDRLLLANRAARRSLGLREGVEGRPIGEVLAEPALLEFYHSASRRSPPGDGESCARKVTLSDGRVFDCALVSAPGAGRVLGMHDVTTFERLNTLKNEFVSQVAHDLKSPLGTIHGYAWLLNDAAGLNEEEREFARNIMRSSDRMRTLIDNLLDIGRIEMGLEADFQPVDLAAVMNNALGQLHGPARDKQVALTGEADDGLPSVSGSPLRLEQAIANLVGNALKFTPAGGAVAVWAGMEAGQVTVRVADSGPGIPPALQAKLFQKFSRLRQEKTRAHEGHGLGLAIVKSIVDIHGGRVWVESQAGQGSTFAFSLPPLNA